MVEVESSAAQSVYDQDRRLGARVAVLAASKLGQGR